MNDLDFHSGQLVIANRILAHEGVVDAYGHVSMRHPGHAECHVLACSRSPELVERADIMTFTLDGTAVSDNGRALYLERFIHSGIAAGLMYTCQCYPPSFSSSVLAA